MIDAVGMDSRWILMDSWNLGWIQDGFWIFGIWDGFEMDSGMDFGLIIVDFGWIHVETIKKLCGSVELF